MIHSSRIRRLHEQLNIFQKVMTANAALMIAGAVIGTWLAFQTLLTRTPMLSYFFTFTLIGIGLSLLLNFFLLRLAFQPLFRLRKVMEQIQAGDYEARAPEIFEDPDVRQLGRTLNQMLDQLAKHRQETSQRILQALEDDRRRIARELHDQTSQSLTFVLIQLDLLKEQLQQGQRTEQLQKSLDRVISSTEEALNSIRSLTHELRPTVLDDLGLVPALRSFVREKVQPLGIDVQIRIVGFEKRLPELMETTVFRICQEALTNIIKHAQADRAEIELREYEHGIQITVTDNGRGFIHRSRRDGQRHTKGLGLVSMEERTKLCNGTFEAVSEPGSGTRISAYLPKEAQLNVGSNTRLLGG